MEAFSIDEYCIEDLRGIPQDYINQYVNDGHLSMDVCDVCNSDSQKGYHYRCAHISGKIIEKDGFEYPDNPITTYYEQPWKIAAGCKFKHELDKGTPCRICGEITESGSDLCDRHIRQKNRLSGRRKELLMEAWHEGEMIEAEMVRKQIEQEIKINK